jgi:hypothetical protein
VKLAAAEGEDASLRARELAAGTRRGSNQRPLPYQGSALPAELRAHILLVGVVAKGGGSQPEPQTVYWLKLGPRPALSRDTQRVSIYQPAH